jgi:hypothetical protein
MDSLKLEQRQQDAVKEKITQLEESHCQVKDYSWLTIGLQRLFRARRALSYSFAFAYFMFGNDIFKDDISEEQNAINQNLFEDQQQQLEETVERLSKLVKPFDTPMELNTDDSSVQDIRLQVINLTTLTDGLCRRMYEVIENDLLGSLQLATHHIAPYKTGGAERASEIFAETVPERTKNAESRSKTDCPSVANGNHVDAELGGKQTMLEVEACDKIYKRPHFEPSSPRFCKRLGKELSVSGPSVVGEAGKTLGSTSETPIENDAAIGSAPSSSFSTTLCMMDTIALGSEDITGQERLKPAGRLLHLHNLNASPPGEADGQDESMQHHSDSTNWPCGAVNATCSSDFDSHASRREMNINRTWDER